MSAELTPDLPLEVAHLLLIDVVGYSKLLVNEQIELLQQLNSIVRSTACFRAAETSGKLIRLPTGDGMALLFFRSPEEPAHCAIEVSKILQNHPDIRVRMAVHSGPVNRIVDVNDMLNVAGAGINVAQRVLDCGDAGHILLSKHLADDLAQYGHWRPYFQDLGEYEVKHGLRLHIVNLCKEDVGNPQMPEKLRRPKRWEKSSTNSIRPVLPPRRWPKWAPMAALLLLACALAFSFAMLFRQPRDKHKPGEASVVLPGKSVAVLPFENLSDDKQNAYFADGIQDEILTDLAKVADLKVISRTSVMQYRNTAQRNIRDIATALGVSHILEGTVRRASGRVRVSAQLIDARTDTHVWAETYERDVADVFAIENELAEQIVSQLKSRLSPKEKAAIEQKPTGDLAAYDLYVRAKILIDTAVFTAPRGQYLNEAVRLLERAVARDPSFVLAFYQLAHAHDQIYLNGIDHTTARLALADAAIQNVRRLAPDSGEAHLASAKHLYWGYLDYEGARQELLAARRALPNDPMPLLLTGYIDRRQGRWDDSIKKMQSALEFDPRNLLILRQIALTYQSQRRYADMAAILDQAVALAPKDVTTRVQRATVDLDWRADPKPLHDVMQAVLADQPDAANVIAEKWLFLALCEHDTAAAARAYAALPAGDCGFDEAVLFPHAWFEGLVARGRGDNAAAKAAFTAARAAAEKTVREQPGNGPPLCALGMIEAALGNRKPAIQAGRRAVELVPVNKDAIDGVVLMEYLAVIYAVTGKKDAAFQQLEQVIKLPGYLSYGQLRLDPMWEPLRGDPRFEKIVAALAPK